ncbi:MAG: protein tyrosine phosphatase [Alphaproteobacteria bacterium]|nr:protein tyrosine phosphatase [Alphaproteobacteria bacterium]MBV9692485.1 protein tyrosine phosphatase [Alphaproteobacteria bacterium]
MRKHLLNRLYNFHWIVPGEAARSSQSYLKMLAPFLHANGLRAVINLRGHHPQFPWWDYENAICAREGVAHLDAMMDSRRLPLRAMLVALLDAFERAPKPFLLKCSGGQDRTSFAAALYLVHRDGWTALEHAQRQFRALPYLHFPRPRQRWLRAFLPLAKEMAQGRPLAQWVRESYDPDEFARLLPAETFNGVWEPWKPRQTR